MLRWFWSDDEFGTKVFLNLRPHKVQLPCWIFVLNLRLRLTVDVVQQLQRNRLSFGQTRSILLCVVAGFTDPDRLPVFGISRRDIFQRACSYAFARQHYLNVVPILHHCAVELCMDVARLFHTGRSAFFRDYAVFVLGLASLVEVISKTVCDVVLALA